MTRQVAYVRIPQSIENPYVLEYAAPNQRIFLSATVGIEVAIDDEIAQS